LYLSGTSLDIISSPVSVKYGFESIVVSHMFCFILWPSGREPNALALGYEPCFSSSPAIDKLSFGAVISLFNIVLGGGDPQPLRPLNFTQYQALAPFFQFYIFRPFLLPEKQD